MPMLRDQAKIAVLAVSAAFSLAAGRAEAQEAPGASAMALTPQESSVLDRISPESLRGHVSFLASDLLEGRGTPSRGLDLAAEYIAAQFRRAGLEPIGDDGYFQTARWREAKSPAEGFAAVLRSGGSEFPLQLDRLSLRYSERAIQIKNAPLVKVSALDPEALKAADPAAMKGKVVLFERPDPATVDRAKYNQVIGGYFRFVDRG